MKKVQIGTPGFTAEASLYKITEIYTLLNVTYHVVPSIKSMAWCCEDCPKVCRLHGSRSNACSYCASVCIPCRETI
jgi:hypothetical protein